MQITKPKKAKKAKVADSTKLDKILVTAFVKDEEHSKEVPELKGMLTYGSIALKSVKSL